MIKIKIIILAAVLSYSFLACQTKENKSETTEKTVLAVTELDSNYVLEKVVLLTDFNQIAQKFGNENVKKDTTIKSPEGKSISVSMLYPNTANELVIYWDAKKPLQKVMDVVVSCDSTGYKGKWHSSSGLQPGQSLEQVVAMNKKDFTISGFDWAYGGRVVSWEGGKLDFKNTAACFANFGNGKITEDQFKNIKGDTEFNVSLEAIKTLNPTVNQVSVFSK
jgi:hypothetical protein